MADKRIFVVAGNIERISPLKDGGMTITMHTQEIPDDQKLLLMSFFNKYGFIAFSEDEVQRSDIPDTDTDIEGRKRKTPSQRLRNTIYVHGEQEGLSGNSEHDAYYGKRMEWHINEEKSYLE
jgi:hypothetical protein